MITILTTIILSSMIPEWHNKQVFEKSHVVCQKDEERKPCAWLARFSILEHGKKHVKYEVRVAKKMDMESDVHKLRTHHSCQPLGIGIYKVKFSRRVFATGSKISTLYLVSSHYCKKK